MVRSLVFAALIGVSSPSLAGGQPGGWSDHRATPSLDRASHRGRTYVYFGHDAWAPRVFSRDDGYFHGRGGGVAVANGQALFDYDRDYPYDFPSRWSVGEVEAHDGYEADQAEPMCEYQDVRERRTGERAEVRICR